MDLLAALLPKTNNSQMGEYWWKPQLKVWSRGWDWLLSFFFLQSASICSRQDHIQFDFKQAKIYSIALPTNPAIQINKPHLKIFPLTNTINWWAEYKYWLLVIPMWWQLLCHTRGYVFWELSCSTGYIHWYCITKAAMQQYKIFLYPYSTMKYIHCLSIMMVLFCMHCNQGWYIEVEITKYCNRKKLLQITSKSCY